MAIKSKGLWFHPASTNHDGPSDHERRKVRSIIVFFFEEKNVA